MKKCVEYEKRKAREEIERLTDWQRQAKSYLHDIASGNYEPPLNKEAHSKLCALLAEQRDDLRPPVAGGAAQATAETAVRTGAELLTERDGTLLALYEAGEAADETIQEYWPELERVLHPDIMGKLQECHRSIELIGQIITQAVGGPDRLVALQTQNGLRSKGTR